MPRIAGVNIPENKKIEIALTYIYGIGPSLSDNILKTANVDVNKRAKSLTMEEVNRLRELVEKNYTVEGDLRRKVMFDIKRLKDIGTYRGQRHTKNLPLRGQRTKTNSRTRRGNKRMTAGSGRKSLEKK